MKRIVRMLSTAAMNIDIVAREACVRFRVAKRAHEMTTLRPVSSMNNARNLNNRGLTSLGGIIPSSSCLQVANKLGEVMFVPIPIDMKMFVSSRYIYLYIYIFSVMIITIHKR